MTTQPRGRYFEDFEVGQVHETPRRTITSTDIVNFACLSGDFNGVHADHEYCKSTPFGEPIARAPLIYAVMGGGFRHAVEKRYGPAAPVLLSAYPTRDDAEATESAIHLRGDTAFGLGNWIWARLQASHGTGRVFYYHFDQVPPARPGVPPGPIHGAELPYVFDNLAIRKIGWTDQDHALADKMSHYWVNFARTGDPNGAGLPHWSGFTSAKPAVMRFGDRMGMMEDVPHRERLEILDADRMGDRIN